MNIEYEKQTSVEKRQFQMQIFEEIKKNQNYEVSITTNGLKRYTGNALSDKKITLGSLKTQFSTSVDLKNHLINSLSLNASDCIFVINLFKKELEPQLNKWFNETAIKIDERDNIQYDTLEVDIEERVSEITEKSNVENHVGGLVYMLTENHKTIQSYNSLGEMQIDYVVSEYDLIEFVRLTISNEISYLNFIKQLLKGKFEIDFIEEPISILKEKVILPTQEVAYKINELIINELEDEDEDDEIGISLF